MSENKLSDSTTTFKSIREYDPSQQYKPKHLTYRALQAKYI